MKEKTAVITYVALSKAISHAASEHKTRAWSNLMKIRANFSGLCRKQGIMVVTLSANLL
jgi:hypothetical protein